MGLTLPLPLHGGDCHGAERRWGRPPLGWLDLSTGLNPWPYPLPSLDAQIWTRLPSHDLADDLCAAAARAYGVPAADHVLAGPGSSALIQAIPRCRPVGQVAIVTPTYGEHARAWAAAGHQVHGVADLDGVGDAQYVVLVNPNNPDGRCHDRRSLLDLADRLMRRDGLLLVDEAFADCRPDQSLAGISRPGLLVLRSFGKFYGLAGIRLGFVLGQPGILAPLAAQLGPWPVSGPALAVGIAALRDDAWAAATRRTLRQWAETLDVALIRAGLPVVGGTDLFRYVRHPRAMEIYDRLGRAGILVRAFEDRPDVLRLGLPAGQPQLDRLVLALKDNDPSGV